MAAQTTRSGLSRSVASDRPPQRDVPLPEWAGRGQGDQVTSGVTPEVSPEVCCHGDLGLSLAQEVLQPDDVSHSSGSDRISKVSQRLAPPPAVRSLVSQIARTRSCGADFHRCIVGERPRERGVQADSPLEAVMWCG